MSATRLAPAARETIARAIAEAGGREVAFVADVDPDGTVTAVEVVARGTAEMVLALPGAAGRGQMALHNHPSGQAVPSEADRRITQRLAEAGRIIQINLIDHLIVGTNSCFSFREAGLL